MDNKEGYLPTRRESDISEAQKKLEKDILFDNFEKIKDKALRNLNEFKKKESILFGVDALTKNDVKNIFEEIYNSEGLMSALENNDFYYVFGSHGIKASLAEFAVKKYKNSNDFKEKLNKGKTKTVSRDPFYMSNYHEMRAYDISNRFENKKKKEIFVNNENVGKEMREIIPRSLGKDFNNENVKEILLSDLKEKKDYIQDSINMLQTAIDENRGNEQYPNIIRDLKEKIQKIDDFSKKIEKGNISVKDEVVPPMAASDYYNNATKGEVPIVRYKERFQKGEKLTTQERAEVSSEILNNAFPNVRFQFAWHSTPHDFDAFTLDHLLKGEGAMAHGWGLYFAKSLPKNYNNYFNRFDVGSLIIKSNGEDISSVVLSDIFDDNDIYKSIIKTSNDLKLELENAKKNLSDKQKYLEEEMDRLQEEYDLDDDEVEFEKHEQQLRIDGLEGLKEMCDDIIENINNNNVEVFQERGNGRFLLVDIPNDNVLIRERAMFKDQPVKVQNAIVKLVNDINKMVGKNPIVKEELLKL